ncbi:MAG: SMP-30/gluconolactonase/LRE family protein [Chloroflexota bacterium]
MADVELIVDAHAVVGEGPVWDSAEGSLVWVDIPAGRVHRYNPRTGENSTITVSQPVGAAVPRASGGLVLAVRDGFAALDTTTGQMQMIADVEADNPKNRMNDGNCDSSGRFWAGTMEFDGAPGQGSLYRLNTDHTVHRVLSDLAISNGIDWSPDNRTMYFVDTRTHGVDVFDYDSQSGAIENRRRLVTIPEDKGSPDGMRVDSEGCLWVALWGGWAVHRYTPTGELERVVPVPASCVSCCAFGGADLTDLYITTASRDLTPGERKDQPHAGGLFRYRPDVVGKAPFSYGG